MKKYCITLLAVLLIFSFTACTAAPAEQTPAPTPVSTSEPTPSPTLEPTPTPEPTLSPEEIEQAKNIEEYEKYKMYYRTYGDDFALLFIRDMLDEEKITEDMFNEAMIIIKNGNPVETGPADELTWETFRLDYEERSSILYGKQEKMYSEALSFVINSLWDYASEGKIPITLFDSEERERVLAGIEIINDFFQSPTDENREQIEDMFFSEELTPGEILLLFTWISSSPDVVQIKEVRVGGKKYSLSDYLSKVIEKYGVSMGKRYVEAYETLIELNNTPNSEKTG